MSYLKTRRFFWLGLFASFAFGTTAAFAGGGAAGAVGIGAGAVSGGTVGVVGAGGATAGGSGRSSVSVASSGHSAASVGGRSSLGGASLGRGNVAGIASPSIGLGNRSLGNPNFGRPGTSIGGNPFGQPRGTLGTYRPATSYPAQIVTRPNNLWSDRTINGGSNTGRNIQVNSQGWQSGAYPYDLGVAPSSTRLYPGSYGYALRSYNDARGNDNRGTDHGRGRYGDYHDGQGHHHNHFYSYYPYYLNGGYFPFVGGYGYYGGLGTDSTYLNNDASLTADLSTYDGGSQPVPQYSVNTPDLFTFPPPPDAPQPAPATRSQTPWTDHQEPAKPSSIGPDSMVEAVQEALAARGYFKGKVDAMFRADTKEAIRRFQTDNNLQPTGLLNNATLTMLGLN